MTRAIFAVAAMVVMLAAGCEGRTASGDRSGEVWIKHRIPSK